jgi:hypothetical protein
MSKTGRDTKDRRRWEHDGVLAAGAPLPFVRRRDGMGSLTFADWRRVFEDAAER